MKDDNKALPPLGGAGDFDWDAVYPKYPYSSEGLTEPTYVSELLPDHWENNIGAMEKAFEWTDEERRELDKAYETSAHGGRPFCEDYGFYVEVLRMMVRKRLKELALEEFEAKRREWLFKYSR